MQPSSQGGHAEVKIRANRWFRPPLAAMVLVLASCGSADDQTREPHQIEATTSTTVAATITDVPFYRANRMRSGIHPGPAPTGQPTAVWTFQAGDEVHFNPVVGNETVFVGSLDGNLYALDARTGVERWRFTGGGEITGSAAVFDDIVYTSDGAGALVALDTEGGNELWRADVDVAVTDSSSPVVADGVVYVASVDGNAYGFDTATGAETWSWRGSQPARGISIGDGVAFIGAQDRRLHAVSLADGQEQWYVPTLSNNVSSSIFDGDSVYVTNRLGPADFTSELLAIDAASGEVRWRFRAPSGLQVEAGAVANGVVYAPTADSGLYALATDDGSQLWQVDIPRSTAVSVVGHELFVTTAEGALIALHESDGSELWRVAIAEGTDWGSAVTGGLIFQGTAKAPSMPSGPSAQEHPRHCQRVHRQARARFRRRSSWWTRSTRRRAASRFRSTWMSDRTGVFTSPMRITTRRRKGLTRSWS